MEEDKLWEEYQYDIETTPNNASGGIMETRTFHHGCLTIVVSGLTEVAPYVPELSEDNDCRYFRWLVPIIKRPT